jgi:hypothetical protein
MKSRLESMRVMPVIEEELLDSADAHRQREETHEVDEDQLRIETFVSDQEAIGASTYTQ